MNFNYFKYVIVVAVAVLTLSVMASASMIFQREIVIEQNAVAVNQFDDNSEAYQQLSVINAKKNTIDTLINIAGVMVILTAGAVLLKFSFSDYEKNKPKA
jgi:hypothetical protein